MLQPVRRTPVPTAGNAARSEHEYRYAGLSSFDLPKGSPIAKRVEHYFADNDVGRFSHHLPAAYFLREQAELLPKQSEATIERARELFERVNRTLGAGQVVSS